MAITNLGLVGRLQHVELIVGRKPGRTRKRENQ